MGDEIKKGLLGIVVDETEVSKVMPEINSLTYRGYAAQDLCEKRLERIEFVKHPGRKQLTWLCRYLSNNQFTYDEMLSGYAWQQLGAGK